MAVLTSDLTIRSVNEALTRASGLSRDDLVGKNFFEVFPECHDVEDSASLRASFSRVIHTCTGDRVSLQGYEVLRAAGKEGRFEERTWSVLNYPLLGEDGRVSYIVHQAAEITELVSLRQKAIESEEALAEATRAYEAVYDQGLFAGRLDLDGRVIDVNRSCLEQCGFQREEVIGKLAWDCGWWNRSPAIQDWVKVAFEQALRGEAFRGDSTYFWADGTERIIEFACMPIKDKGGKIQFIVATGMDITERFLTEKDHRATAILESISDAFFALDREWRFTYLNRQAERILGCASRELIGKVLWEVYPGFQASEFRKTYLKAAEERTPSSITAYYADHDRWYEMHASPSPQGISIYFRDVSGRVSAEVERTRLAEETERERRMYQAALSSTPDLVYVFDINHRFLYANPALLRMWGRSWEESIGKTCHELGYEPWHAERHDREIDRVIATRQPIRGEVPYTGTNGRRIYDYIFVPVIGVDGAVQAVVGTTRDVTDRKKGEEIVKRLNVELARRVRELQTIFETASVGINVAEDAGCKVIAGNRVFSQMLGMPHGENLSMLRPDMEAVPYSIVKGGRELEAHELPMQRAAAKLESVEEVVEIVRGDGSRITVLMTAKPILDDHGKAQGAVGIGVDITRLTEMEEALRQTNRRKDEFLAMLAHELRNPLAAVSNAITVLKLSGDVDNMNFAKDVIDRQTRQLARLIDDLLDVSRITSGKIRLKRELVDAGTILKQAIESVAPLIDERKHELLAEFEEGTLPLRADPTRIEQVVVNLMTNAAKYTESGGRIGVTAKRDGDQIVIAVEDNGIGIPPDRLPEMFELFSQGERSIARSEGGLGIGLTIVQKLTEMHGGRVSAFSSGPGLGSTFTIHLPAASRRRDAETDLPALTARRGSRILVVDDNVDTARGMVRLLKLLGNEVQVAYDGLSALELARHMNPEFILLDIGLPGMDGYEVATKLRRDPCCKTAVIIAVSGYGHEEDRRRSREAGFDHHLVKPIDFDSLVSLMAQSA